MSAYVLPNIILFVAVVGLLGVLARHLPEAQRQIARGGGNGGSGKARFWFLVQGRLRSAWRFILEAKGLRDPAGTKFRMQQLLAQNRRKVRTKQTVGTSEKVAEVSVVPVRSKSLGRTRPLQNGRAPVVTQATTKIPEGSAEHASVSHAAQIETSMALAKQYLDNKQYFEARKLLESMDQSFHASPVYWARLGYAQYHLAAYSEAVRCYERSLALDGQQPNRYYNLALAYQATGSRARALANLEKAIAKDPKNTKYLETKQALLT